jgi:sterol desaturase/sphingolipid hydroxylase (fatty acid hydroxylase superfamily)
MDAFAFDPAGWLSSLVRWLQLRLFEDVLQPILFATGAMTHAEALFDLTEWVVLGAIEVGVLAAVLIPLERRFAVEPLMDRRAVRIDILYTLLHRLGGFAIVAFFVLTPLVDAIEGQLRLLGLSRPNLDQAWPGVTDLPLVSFLVYLVVLDFVDYWLHRGQHAIRWWWELHALHHSQRQMTFWSDQRNHLLDDLLRDAILALVAIAIGVAPEQFVLLVIAARVIESVQHANLRWRFGALGERLLVSPSFHRLHHAIGHGHEGPARGVNFAVLFPCWDVLFRTADFRPGFLPTGIRDQLQGRDYGRGFWAQQWLAIKRIAGRA